MFHILLCFGHFDICYSKLPNHFFALYFTPLFCQYSKHISKIEYDQECMQDQLCRYKKKEPKEKEEKSKLYQLFKLYQQYSFVLPAVPVGPMFLLTFLFAVFSHHQIPNPVSYRYLPCLDVLLLVEDLLHLLENHHQKLIHVVSNCSTRLHVTYIIPPG